MKKQVKVKTYTRTTKSGKKVTVRQHTANRDAAREKALKGKSGSGSPFKKQEYDEDMQELVITFANGSKYRYHDVPQSMADAIEENQPGALQKLRSKYTYSPENKSAEKSFSSPTAKKMARKKQADVKEKEKLKSKRVAPKNYRRSDDVDPTSLSEAKKNALKKSGVDLDKVAYEGLPEKLSPGKKITYPKGEVYKDRPGSMSRMSEKRFEASVMSLPDYKLLSKYKNVAGNADKVRILKKVAKERGLTLPKIAKAPKTAKKPSDKKVPKATTGIKYPTAAEFKRAKSKVVGVKEFKTVRGITYVYDEREGEFVRYKKTRQKPSKQRAYYD